MADTLSEMIGYHNGRAVEEMERAEAFRTGAGRRAHLELSRLHSSRAGSLRSKLPACPPPPMVRSTELDMGEASREQGFRLFGCR